MACLSVSDFTVIAVLVLVLVFMAGIATVVLVFLKYSARSHYVPMQPPPPEPVGPESQLEDGRETD